MGTGTPAHGQRTRGASPRHTLKGQPRVYRTRCARCPWAGRPQGAGLGSAGGSIREEEEGGEGEGEEGKRGSDKAQWMGEAPLARDA